MGWCHFCKTHKSKWFRWIYRDRLLLLTIGSVIFGITLGFIMRFAELNSIQRYYWGFLGDVIMMNMLKCTIVPLIILSILTGVASLAEGGSQLSMYAVVYYILTTVTAIILGILLVLGIGPGWNIESTQIMTATNITQEKQVADGLLDIVRNMFPPNIIEALFNQASTARSEDNTKIIVTYGGSQNVLGMITFCSCFGYYLGQLANEKNDAAQSALLLFNGLNEALMRMVDLMMWYVPIGLIFLISCKIMSMGDDMGAIWLALGKFIITTLLGLFIHGFVILPLIYYAIVRQNPFRFMAGVSQAMITAFANASTAATLPITMRCVEQNNRIDPRVTRFMLPLGATINMDGTALYEAVAAIFIAQMTGVNLGLGQVITIAVTATAASIGAAAIPSAGLITLIIVLTAVGLPTEPIALILTVDWLLDRVRTALNVWGDAVGCGIVQHLNQEYLNKSIPEFLTQVENSALIDGNDSILCNLRSKPYAVKDEEDIRNISYVGKATQIGKVSEV